MANLVKITGLQHGRGGSDSGPASVRGFRVKSALGRQYSNASGAVAATLASGTVSFAAKYKGTYGNNIVVDENSSGAGTAATVSVAWAASTGYPTITINANTSATNATVVAAVNAHPVAGQLVTAATSAGSSTFAPVAGTGSGDARNLAGGSNGTATDKEPPYGVLGEPIWFRVTDGVTVIVDTDDRVVQRSLQRNNWRYISLGAI